MNLVHFGYFGKTQGLKGQLVLKTELNFFADDLKVLFVEMAGEKAPYFVANLKETNLGILVTLEDVDVIEKARALVGKQLFIDEVLLDKSEAEMDWTGFELIDKHYGPLGIISGVTDNGQQVLLNVDHKGKEVILPLVEDFIEKIDEAQKKIYFNAPEGLIDVYLGSASGDERDGMKDL